MEWDPAARVEIGRVAMPPLRLTVPIAVPASEKMTEPVEGTLFFAGEHTDTQGHWGTVHGALGSGTRAATQLLAVGHP